MSSILKGIRKKAELLASTSLSEPWSQTKQKVVSELTEWQIGLTEAEKSFGSIPNAELEESEKKLHIALNLILEAVRKESPVNLSNALANEFVDTINTLDTLIAKS